MTAVQTAVFLPTKPSSNDDFRFRNGFKAEVSLLQRFLTISPGFDGLSILYGNAKSMLIQSEPYSGSFIIYFLLSGGESSRLVRYAEVGF